MANKKGLLISGFVFLILGVVVLPIMSLLYDHKGHRKFANICSMLAWTAIGISVIMFCFHAGEDMKETTNGLNSKK
jgi:Na+/melibiose symporter-like transporter